MFGSQDAAVTDHDGRLHKLGDASYKRFIDTFKSVSYNLAAHYFQSASVFTEKNKMCDASFAQALQSNILIVYIGIDSSEPGDQ